MRIQHNMNSMFAYRQFMGHQKRVSRALQRLSSGYRINSAADDPAGLAMSERMRAAITENKQAIRNAQSGLDMANIADGTLSSVTSALRRLAYLGEYASNGTLDNADRAKIQNEAKQLLEGIYQMAGLAKYGNESLLTEDKSIDIHLGGGGKDYDQLMLQLPDLKSALSMLDGLDFSTQASARQSLDTVKQALNEVNNIRAGIGAQSNRLEHTISGLESATDALTEAESRIRDADMAKEMADYVRGKVLSEVAGIMMAHANKEPEKVLAFVKTVASAT